MIVQRLIRAGFLAAAMLLAAAPASAAVIVYTFEGLGKFKTEAYTMDYFSGEESSSESVFDHVPFEATLTIDTAQVGATGGLVAQWSGVPFLGDPLSFAASTASNGEYDELMLSNRGVVFDVIRSSFAEAPDGLFIHDSLTSTARLRLLDNELSSAPTFTIDGYSFPDLTDFMIEFSLNTMAFEQMINFDDMFVETGDVTQIFSVGRATMSVINAVPEPPHWAMMAAALALFGMVGSSRRHAGRVATAEPFLAQA